MYMAVREEEIGNVVLTMWQDGEEIGLEVRDASTHRLRYEVVNMEDPLREFAHAAARARSGERWLTVRN